MKLKVIICTPEGEVLETVNLSPMLTAPFFPNDIKFAAGILDVLTNHFEFDYAEDTSP